MSKDDSLLPSPSEIGKIVRMYNSNRYCVTKQGLTNLSFSIDSHQDSLLRGKVIKPFRSAFDRINIYMLNRSMHQINEACNKLWSTMELVNVAKSNRKLCRTFSENFLPSSIIPTLHYSNISAILSTLSLFGMCSIARKSNRKLIFFNIVRTAEGIILMERSRYLIAVFGTAKHGWHRQVLQTYRSLVEKGIYLPEINMEKSERLLHERNRLDYDILAQTSMRDVYGLELYFDLAPVVFSSIEAAMTALHEVIKPLPNKCDRRFAELTKKMADLVLNNHPPL